MIATDVCIIICFPPGAGGNHLRNLIAVENLTDRVYVQTHSKSVHAASGSNFRLEDLHKSKIAHGHFGEIMSFQNEIRQIEPKRWILISTDSASDRKLLRERRDNLQIENLKSDQYLEGEQIFLYESFMYHYYFGTAFDDIMNISISELFTQDISPLLSRLSCWLGRQLDLPKCLIMHDLWYRKNF